MKVHLTRFLVFAGCLLAAWLYWTLCLPYVDNIRPWSPAVIVLAVSTSGAILGGGTGALFKIGWRGALIGLVATGWTMAVIVVFESRRH